MPGFGLATSPARHRVLDLIHMEDVTLKNDHASFGGASDWESSFLEMHPIVVWERDVTTSI